MHPSYAAIKYDLECDSLPGSQLGPQLTSGVIRSPGKRLNEPHLKGPKRMTRHKYQVAWKIQEFRETVDGGVQGDVQRPVVPGDRGRAGPRNLCSPEPKRIL